MPDFHKLAISEVKKETPSSVSITLEIPENLQPSFTFKAGQYITIKHTLEGKELRRAYSLCSSPTSGSLRVGIKKVENGSFSVYANTKLKVGDVLEVMQPEGAFVFEPQNNLSTTYGAFVAGSGITPVLSIIKDILEREPNSSFVLVYGNQTLTECMFYSELETLKSEYTDRLKIEYIYSRSKELNALQGRIDKSVVNYLLKNKYGKSDFSSFYLCGPETMIEEVSNTLKDRGIAKENIFFELFTTSNEGELEENHDGTTSVTITLDDETDTFVMDQKKSVLEAALKHGLDAPFSCQGGICSTCIARITEGKVEMRKNQILTDSELEEGLILTCQAHPTTSKVVIDYDDV